MENKEKQSNESFRQRLYLSTTAEDAPALARDYGLGLEIAEFCTASHMDRAYAESVKRVDAAMDGVARCTFHAPFNELSPAAIDPLARELAMMRYRQAAVLAAKYGAKKLVIHTGFIPRVYHPAWFIPESVRFWREFLAGMTEDLALALENVMETGPDIPLEIAERVDDPRFRLCLDVGHANLFAGVTPIEAWIDRCAPLLTHVHLHSNDGAEDLHQCLGEGEPSIGPVLDRLERLCPDVTYAVENGSAAGSVRWLRTRGYIE